MITLKAILQDASEENKKPTEVEIKIDNLGIGIKIEGCETYDGENTSIYMEVYKGIPRLLIYPVDDEEPIIIPLKGKI